MKRLLENAQIREKFKVLRMQNIAPKDAHELLAEETGKAYNTIRGICGAKGAALDEFKARPDFSTHGTSTLFDADGNIKLQWVKEKRDNEKEQAEEMIKALAENLPKAVKTEPRSATFRKDAIAVYPMGDPHFGMFAWGEEAGEDFDLKIAERDLCHAVSRLVDTVPACEEALIINLGDFFHSDNQQGTTTKGTRLDTDTRWSKVLRVGIKAIRQCIESALVKHKKVTIINAIGNHDEHTSLFLSIALSNIYEDEPRVNVIADPTVKHYYRFGKNLFGIHHGHTIKMQDLPFQMASDRPQDWADSEYRFFFTGHIHHDSKKEFGGVIVESFRTLAAKDAWHTSMGYKAGRDMKSILFHRDFGEIERHTVSVDMLRS